MQFKLISNLKSICWIIILVSGCVCGCLLVSAVETQFLNLSNKPERLAQIEAAQDLRDLKTLARATVIVGSYAGTTSLMLLAASMLTLFVFMVLAGISLRWLGRLENIAGEMSLSPPRRGQS